MSATTRARVDLTPKGKPVKHGSYSYDYYGCRCDECTEAATARITRQRTGRSAEDAPDGSHGKQSTYVNWNCRCAPCVAANSAACKAYQASLKARKQVAA